MRHVLLSVACLAAVGTFAVGCASTKSADSKKPVDSQASKPAAAPSATSGPAAALPAGWVSLFNGRDLTGWKPFLADANADPASVWSVKDGVLVCSGKPAGYIATTAQYTSFELELEWRFDPEKGEGNSGVLLRVQEPDKVWPLSVEAQLQSKNAGDIWNIDGFPMKTDADRTKGRWTGKLKPTNEKPLGEWNKYHIVMAGSALALIVNGELQNRATDVRVVPGRIALQSEGAHIEFRNIRIRPLDGATMP